VNIRVLRESGGIGDIVRVLPVLAGLRAKYPDATLHAFVPERYVDWVRRPRTADKVFDAPNHRWSTRRGRLADPDPKKWPYLETGVVYDLTVDCYCPAYRHEADHPFDVWNDRIELFCAAAEVPPSRPQLPVKRNERDAAAAFLEKAGIARRNGWVALQPHSTDPGRDWPHAHWAELADALSLSGYGVFWLDSWKTRCADIPCPGVARAPLNQLAAILAVCDLIIGPDSGLNHLAGAVGTRALGLTCSQSGAVLYRHYPGHRYAQPPLEATPKGCRWPCLWKRKPECVGHRLRKAGKTCAALAGLPPADVHDAAASMLAECRVVNSEWGMQNESVLAPTIEAVRHVQESVPRGGFVLDVAGGLARGARALGIPLDRRCETAWQIPHPVFDRAIHEAALFAVPEGDSAEQWLWELFRVLDVVGRLYAPPEIEPLAKRMGFHTWKRTDTWARYEKRGTWPKNLETRD